MRVALRIAVRPAPAIVGKPTKAQQAGQRDEIRHAHEQSYVDFEELSCRSQIQIVLNYEAPTP